MPKGHKMRKSLENALSPLKLLQLVKSVFKSNGRTPPPTKDYTTCVKDKLIRLIKLKKIMNIRSRQKSVHSLPTWLESQQEPRKLIRQQLQRDNSAPCRNS